MRFRLNTRGVELTASDRAQIGQMVRQALGPHTAGLASAEVGLLPSPRIQGARYVCCRIRVRGRAGRSFLAEAHDAGARGAAFGASARIAHRLELERRLLGLQRPIGDRR